MSFTAIEDRCDKKNVLLNFFMLFFKQNYSLIIPSDQITHSSLSKGGSSVTTAF